MERLESGSESAILNGVEEKPSRPCFYKIVHNILFIIILGQLISFCGSVASVSTEYLYVMYMIEIPELQTFFTYVILMLICIPSTIVSYLSGTFQDTQIIDFQRLPYYILASLLDYEASFLVIFSFQFIGLLNVTLILCLTTPFVMLLNILRTRNLRTYVLIQYIGVLISISGVVILIFVPEASTKLVENDRSYVGYICCLSGAFLYSLSSLLQESLVKEKGALLYLFYLGIFGSCIASAQNMFINLAEHHDAFFWCSFDFVSLQGLCVVVYAFCIFSFYALMPIFFKLSNATLFNLSLLTTAIYSMILSILIFEHQIPFGYFVAFCMVIFGLVTFNYPALKVFIDSKRKSILSDGHEEHMTSY